MESFNKNTGFWLIFSAIALLLLYGCINQLAQTSQGGQDVSQAKEDIAKDAGAEAEEGSVDEAGAGTSDSGISAGGGASMEEEIKKTKMKEISFTTKDRWLIYGDIYYAEKKSPEKALVLLHQLGADRKSYSDVIPVLQDNLPDYDIIALDLRGHGKSTNLGSYSSFTTGDYRAMKNDLEGLKTYLSVSRPNIKEFYLIGSSIGSSVALVYAANDGDVKKTVMISPGISYHDYDITQSARDYLYGLCIAAGFEDRYSSESAQKIYDMSPSDSKKIKIYYGTDAHGAALFNATKNSDVPLMQFVLSCLR